MRGLTLLAGIGLGAGLGAGLLYLLDPQMGRRRRSLVRDQASRLWNQAQEGFGALREDVTNRASGLAHEARSRFQQEEVSDRVLCDRVRSHLGRVVSHPHSIQVTAQNGHVTLSGPILAHEVGRLMSCTWGVPGVRGVDNRLEPHEEAGNISALQGGRTRPGERWEMFQDHWSPTMRLMAGLAGAGLLAYGFTQEAPWACVTGSFGIGLLAAGITDTGVSDLLPESAGDWMRGSVRPDEWVRQGSQSLAHAAREVASSARQAVGV